MQLPESVSGRSSRNHFRFYAILIGGNQCRRPATRRDARSTWVRPTVTCSAASASYERKLRCFLTSAGYFELVEARGDYTSSVSDQLDHFDSRKICHCPQSCPPSILALAGHFNTMLCIGTHTIQSSGDCTESKVESANACCIQLMGALARES